MKKFIISLSLILPFLFFSCNKKQIKKDSTDLTNTENVQKIEDINTLTESTDTLKEANIRNPEFINNEEIQTIHFDFDKYDLTDKDRNILNQNAKILKEKKWTILIEGYCDDRGTIEYNLALGQKRANIVKEYYMRLGIPENDIGTISYGKENPICTEETDSCWSENRRAETKVNYK